MAGQGNGEPPGKLYSDAAKGEWAEEASGNFP